MSKLDFCENVVLNISSGVIGGCIVSYFVFEVKPEELNFMMCLVIVFSVIILGIRFISEKRQKKDSTNNTIKATDKVDEKGDK
ncbi:hypothetical protein CRU92_01535 [Arcobacter sp. FW59]|nr:hypothetical protein CRU92_01535 [Arcobacter sp. FW59]